MNHGAGFGVMVVAIAACSDAAAPVATAKSGVVYTYPADGQIDVPLGARVVVTFSDAVAGAAIAPCTQSGAEVLGAFCVVGPEGPVAAMPAVVGDGRTVELASAGFAPGTTYEVYARPALAPGAANLPASGPLFRFTTRSTRPRAAPPALVAVNGGPPSAPDGFRPMFESSTIRLVFSEPLDPRTVVLAPGALELVDAAGAAVPATLFAQGIHVAIDPTSDLVPGMAYQLKIGAQLADLGGDHVAPIAIALTPVRGGVDHPIQERLRTRRDGDPGPAQAHAGAARNAIGLAEPLIGALTAQVMPSVLATELSDPTASARSIAFTIRRGQRMQAQGLDIELGGVVPAGLATGAITIELLTDGGGRIYRNPYQDASQRPDGERALLIADLSLDLAIYASDATGNAVLTQTVLGVQASGVVIATEAVLAIDLDLLGVASAPTNLVLELITDPSAAVAPDLAAPALLASLPSAGDELAVDAGVELIFDKPIDLDRARAGGIRLETAVGQTVASVIESHGAAVVVRPVAPLAYGTGYRVRLGDVVDLAGHLLTGVAPIAFSTPPLVATGVPLGIAAVHPGVPCALTGGVAGNTAGGPAETPGRCAGGGASDDAYQPFTLAANEPVEIRFTQPPVPASITHTNACNAGSARVEQVDAAGACIAAVAGTWIQHERALSFVPDAAWQVGTRYRLTLVSGGDVSCAAGEICGIAGAASFDALAGGLAASAGGPDLAIAFTGAPATDATLVVTQAQPFSDVNGSGAVEAGELAHDANRVALRITGTTGIATAASFHMADCLPATADIEACMYLAGAMPVELLPAAHDCPLPGGDTAASCVPVALSPQVMYGTSLALDATALIGVSTVNISTVTGRFVMRIREPAHGPVTGYLIDDHGTPTLVVALDLYLDAPDMSVPLLDDDVHGKPLSVSLRGPLRFLPDGRISIAVTNVAELPISVGITGEDHGTPVAGAVHMVIPRGEMKLALVSPPVRGGLP